jgi:hypothetical protein
MQCSRTVIPAKAGIQAGFRLALRLAGMTEVLAEPQSAIAGRIFDTP